MITTLCLHSPLLYQDTWWYFFFQNVCINNSIYDHDQNGETLLPWLAPAPRDTAAHTVHVLLLRQKLHYECAAEIALDSYVGDHCPDSVWKRCVLGRACVRI